ncbi:hypothetical protein, partial [Burkholderia sp. SCN-KJ]|uniref:hypothetical protein n=1 Tax=Burkholderia sp. SCN-KJ TaxID=2969248 RepID=UPI0021505E1B
SARNFVLLSSAAFSAAEKRDYEPSFSVRQQLFNYFVATAGVQLRVRRGSYNPPSTAPLPFFPRAAFPLARKRRDSKHLPAIAQGVSRKI